MTTVYFDGRTLEIQDALIVAEMGLRDGDKLSLADAERYFYLYDVMGDLWHVWRKYVLHPKQRRRRARGVYWGGSND